jgi:hypothetical protein
MLPNFKLQNMKNKQNFQIWPPQNNDFQYETITDTPDDIVDLVETPLDFQDIDRLLSTNSFPKLDRRFQFKKTPHPKQRRGRFNLSSFNAGDELDLYTGKTECPTFLLNSHHNRVRDMLKKLYGLNPIPSDDEVKFIANNNLLGK